MSDVRSKIRSSSDLSDSPLKFWLILGLKIAEEYKGETDLIGLFFLPVRESGECLFKIYSP